MELRVEDSGQALLTLDGYTPLLQQITLRDNGALKKPNKQNKPNKPDKPRKLLMSPVHTF